MPKKSPVKSIEISPKPDRILIPNPDGNEHIDQVNKLNAAIHYFGEKGIQVTIKWKASGFMVTMKQRK